MTRGRKLTGQFGVYDFCCEAYPKNQLDERLFSMISITFDKSDKHQGFCIVINAKEHEFLRFIKGELKLMRTEQKEISGHL
jgi:hypothetical protein